MFFDVFPMLTKGGFALYYGGDDILDHLEEGSGSPVSPIMMLITFSFQLTSFLFKKHKLKKLYRNQSGKVLRFLFTFSSMFFSVGSGITQPVLISTLLAGFNNVYTLSVFGKT